MSYNGLNFETPSLTPTPDCNRIKSTILKIPESKCYLWGNDFYLTIRYLKYGPPDAAPSPADMLRRYQAASAEIDGESTLKTSKEATTIPMTISGAEAVRLRTFTGFGTVASVQEHVFIRKGSETWQVEIIHPLRWDFDEEAAKRILASLSFGPTAAGPSVPALPPAPKTAAEYYVRALNSYKKNNDKSAEADLNEAIRLDPKMADAYILRARIYCHQKLIISAIREEDKAIALGGKVDYRCGRTSGPVPR
jgi:tetratricopeptide (TPR) repeat protein